MGTVQGEMKEKDMERKTVLRAIKHIFVGWSILFLVSTICAPAIAQQTVEERATEVMPGSRYYISIGAEDEILIRVNVWGQVLKPGQYMVPSDTDIISLLSYAGGPTENSKLSDVRIVRNTQDASEVISVDIKKYVETADLSLIGLLQPGDTVVVPASTYHLFSRFVGFVSQIAVITNVYYLLFLR